jgi:hypothetical protein
MEYFMEDKMSLLKRLQAQRSDIMSKLNRIEEKRSSVSAEVYDKVKKEYADKLKGIDEQLTSNIDILAEEIQRLKAQEEEIIQKMKEAKFRMEEMELRYSIGEYDESSFKKAKAEDDVLMKQYDGELKRTRDGIQYYSAFTEGKEPEVVEAAPSEKPVKEESKLTIDEHILEEKLPEEEVALEELLSEEEAVSSGVTAGSAEEKSAEEEKGVACPKCNHINTPDSWYCEKCGAEILGASGS